MPVITGYNNSTITNQTPHGFNGFYAYPSESSSLSSGYVRIQSSSSSTTSSNWNRTTPLKTYGDFTYTPTYPKPKPKYIVEIIEEDQWS